ncbi:MAG: von Willebrand factor type A domain-containing protein [Bacteroidota bacterium]
MKKALLWICMLGILLIQADQPQLITVNGIVTDAETGDPLPGASVLVKGTTHGVATDVNGKFILADVPEKGTLIVSFVGYDAQEIAIEGRTQLSIKMKVSNLELDEVVVIAKKPRRKRAIVGSVVAPIKAQELSYVQPEADEDYGALSEQVVEMEEEVATLFADDPMRPQEEPNREGYDQIAENDFRKVEDAPLSTFSIDVDKASYANVRRFINEGRQPIKGAVRIEEMVNYFDYDYPQPKGEDPINIITEMATCPWHKDHHILQIALKGKELDIREAPASNLVFLLDVSGSMNYGNKLPLLKKALNLLIDNMRAEDRVAIVVYAGAAGLVLPSTSGIQKEKIRKALNKLSAGGSTAGGAGIQLAYKVALENFIEGANNRVILATDGDFNVGASSDAEMTDLIKEKRDKGVFLTVLGFGTGNYQDAKMEKIADNGNGNYAYIDNILEAQKVLVNEMSGTLYTIAKDVKIQIEFNPNKVKGYRLIGYENRMLKNEDFNNDKKDAGELGAGHTVTALYEIIPADTDEELVASVDPLKYQKVNKTRAADSKEWVTVKFRYKKPDEDTSKLIVKTFEGKPSPFSKVDENLQFASSVAGFGMLLRDSNHKGELSYEDVLEMAKGSKGKDEEGYRAEFISLVKKVKLMN